MLTQTIVWIAFFLELLILVRGIQGRLFLRFPLFFSYLAYVFLQSIVLYAIFQSAPEHYTNAYWYCEFVALVFGSLILVEIYRIALRPYPGTARIARNLLLFVFALTFAKVLVNQSFGAVYWPATTTAELERNLRVVQGFAILAMVVVLFLYSIPRDRNLRGILGGYGFFVACTIVQLSLLTHLGSSFNRLWSYAQPFSYVVVLCVWAVTLWSPAPETISPPAALHLAVEDHPTLVARSKQDLQGVDLGLPGAFRR
jgi:hypothetical protein